MSRLFDSDVNLDSIARVINSLDPVNPQDLVTLNWATVNAVELVFNTFASFPVTGNTTKLYIATDTNIAYRWTGSAYVSISAAAQGSKGDIQFRGNTAGSFASASSSRLSWDDNKTSLQIGVSPSATLADALITSTKSTNSFTQTIIQNLSGGTQASADLVCNNDLGTDTNYYVDLGINSSGFSDPSQPFSGPNDAYLYSQDGSLTIGTNTTGKNLIFHTGGFAATNERMRIIDNATQKDSLISLSSHLRWLNDTTANRPTTPLAGTVRYNTTQAKFEGYENGSWQNFMPYDYRTTTTQASTSTTYANITQLQSVSLPVGNYKFKAVIKFQTAATTTGIGLRFSNNSATVSDILAMWTIPIGVDLAANNTLFATQRTVTDNILGTSVGAASTNYAAFVEGIFTISVAGTVGLQFRTEVSGSSATIGSNSYLSIEGIV